ncbi:MAG: hypothetical protein ACI97A_002654 [Planctomycetota bacterium]
MVMGTDPDVFRSTIQPDLLRLGLVTVTPLGLSTRPNWQSTTVQEPQPVWQTLVA